MDVQPLGGVLRLFFAISDPRRHKVTYFLSQLLTLALMACLCGCDDDDSADRRYRAQGRGVDGESRT